MSENMKNVNQEIENDANSSQEQYSLNDDRRVKVLSPGAMVAKRFFRNRLAVTGLVILVFMFLFSFVGGAISPYGEGEQFYRVELHSKEYAAVIENKEFRYTDAGNGDYTGVIQAQSLLAHSKGQTAFNYKGVNYTLTLEGENFFSVAKDGQTIGIAYKDIVNASSGEKLPYNFQFAILKAFTNGETGFSFEGTDYTVAEDGTVMLGEEVVAFASNFIVQSAMSDIIIEREFKDQLIESIEADKDVFEYTDANGETYEYAIKYDAPRDMWSIRQEKETRVFDTYAAPSKEHWLGTDKNGMDMMTRLMYGGRVSLIIGFIVVVIQTVLGVIMGGISGYFGGWVDNLIMRLVDIFYCIPSMPIIIILGAVMDEMRVDPWQRMLYLMLILGVLGWAGIARLVRGQILSLREQEFMTAAEATGIRVHHRIFRHLIPNVIPQLIVTCTMGLGSTIITEATLSFLGLGVKFPFASWGNIINDVNDTFVLTTYWFIWIPAGVLLLLTVLAFNILGDGLRDAFDPKMKR